MSIPGQPPGKMKKMGFTMPRGNRTGEKALAFSLIDENDREILLEDFKGSWLLMVFHRHLA